MALSDFQNADTIARSRQGTIDRNLGAKPVVATTVPTPTGNVLQKAFDVGKQTLNIAETIGKKTAGFVAHTVQDVTKQGIGAAKTFVDFQTQPIANKVYSDLGRTLDQHQQDIISAYKSGKMSKSDYLKATDDLGKAFTQLSKETQKISAGPTPQQRATDIANTAVNALTLGSFTTEKALTKEVASGITGKLENVVTKIPAVRDLAERNAQSLLKALPNETFGQALKTNGKDLAIGLLIKRPIFYQSNVSGAQDVYDHILKGQYGDAAKSSAWLASQMLSGGPIGAFLKGASWMKKGIGDLAYGHGSFIDEISKKIGNGNPAQIARFLSTIQKKAPNEFEEANKVFKILQETNLQASRNDAQRAAESVLTHYEQNGIPLSSVTPSQLYKDFSNWSKADELAQKTIRQGVIKGVSPEDASKYVVVRWDKATKDAVAAQIAQSGTGFQARMDALEQMASQPGVSWGNNDILMKRLSNVISQGGTPEELSKAIKGITTASTILTDMPKKVAKELADLGYSIARPARSRKTPIVAREDLRKLVTGAIKGDNQVFDVTQSPDPSLHYLASLTERIGLSPRSSNEIANRKLQESVVSSLTESPVTNELGIKNIQGGDSTNAGKVILSKLSQYIENKPASRLGNILVGGTAKQSAITDIRQLSTHDIKEALNVTSSQARSISNAIMDGYLNVPLEYRGLGDKIVDGLYAVNPMQKYYSRIQSALRYTYNPFFRTQERVETKLLAHAQANNLVWGKSRNTLDEAAQKLDDARIFTSTLPGEAAQDQVLGRITANITQGQKRDLAGLALDMAKSRGITLDQMISEHSDELDDALRVVVQYPTHGILASSLARTMNVAFFPIRYNTKVTLLAARTLAKQPPSIQKAVIHSIFQMKDWLKSDEGLAWQQQHADAIQVLNWITPINSVEYVFNLLGHKPNSISDLGMLGGLPLGVITQILDGQGIIKLNTPYVNPKTGDVIPSYIPQTTRARAAVALTDLIGSTFTYPGRILGLPGKDASIRKLIKNFIDTNGSDFDKQLNLDKLTPLQQNMIRVLKGDTSQQALDAIYNSPLPDGYQGYTLPPTTLPYKAPILPEQRTGLPVKASTKKTKQKNYALPIQ